MRTFRHGSPTASAWSSSSRSRTACIDTRSNSAVTVVSSPTTSTSGERRSAWSAQALSLPLLQASHALGRATHATYHGDARSAAAVACAASRRSVPLALLAVLLAVGLVLLPILLAIGLVLLAVFLLVRAL